MQKRHFSIVERVKVVLILVCLVLLWGVQVEYLREGFLRVGTLVSRRLKLRVDLFAGHYPFSCQRLVGSESNEIENRIFNFPESY